MTKPGKKETQLDLPFHTPGYFGPLFESAPSRKVTDQEPVELIRTEKPQALPAGLDPDVDAEIIIKRRSYWEGRMVKNPALVPEKVKNVLWKLCEYEAKQKAEAQEGGALVDKEPAPGPVETYQSIPSQYVERATGKIITVDEGGAGNFTFYRKEIKRGKLTRGNRIKVKALGPWYPTHIAAMAALYQYQQAHRKSQWTFKEADLVRVPSTMLD